jgi:hypothetical protein
MSVATGLTRYLYHLRLDPPQMWRRQKRNGATHVFVLTKLVPHPCVQACVRARVTVRRQTAETASRNPGPARRRKLEAQWYSTKVRVSTTRVYVKGGGGDNSGPEGEEKGVGQQARREAVRLGSSGVGWRTSFLGLGYEEAAFQVRALYNSLRTYVFL